MYRPRSLTPWGMHVQFVDWVLLNIQVMGCVLPAVVAIYATAS
jgi:hypothetical protein